MSMDMSVDTVRLESALSSITPEDYDRVRGGDPKLKEEVLRLARLGLKKTRRMKVLMRQAPSPEGACEVHKIHEQAVDLVFKIQELMKGVSRHG